MLKNQRNRSLFSRTGTIVSRVSAVSVRVDLTDDEKLDLTDKVKQSGLTTLGPGVILDSSTHENLRSRATGTFANRDSNFFTRQPPNRFLDTLNDLWNHVLQEVSEISWIDHSSKTHWSLKKWTSETPMNPPCAKNWITTLETAGVQSHIDYYVESKTPEPRHQELRRLLRLLQTTMCEYREAKDKRTNTSH